MIQKVDAAQSQRLSGARCLELGSLSLRSAREGDVHTIELTGELDLVNAVTVQHELERVEREDALTILIDLSELTFIDSTGVRLVLSAHARSVADGGRLTLLRGPRAVQRVFEICGVDELLPFAR